MKTLKLTRALDEAIILATRSHSKQKDLGGMPYILHPLRVMSNCHDIKEKIVGVLHDVIEDTDVTLDDLRDMGFSEEIIDAVDAISRRLDEKYSDYINRLSKNPIAVNVKIEDIKDNLDLTRLNKAKKNAVDKMPEILKPLREMVEIDLLKETIVDALHDIVSAKKAKPEQLIDAGFSSEIVDAVDALLIKPGEKYSAHIERISKNPLAVIVKIKSIKDIVDFTEKSKNTDSPDKIKRSEKRARKYKTTIAFLKSTERDNKSEDSLCMQ